MKWIHNADFHAEIIPAVQVNIVKISINATIALVSSIGSWNIIISAENYFQNNQTVLIVWLALTVALLVGTWIMIIGYAFFRIGRHYATRPIISPQISRPALEPNRYSRVAIKDILTHRFNLSELEELMFELNIDTDKFGDIGLSELARELVDYVDRHNRFGELVEVVRATRPDIGI